MISDNKIQYKGGKLVFNLFCNETLLIISTSLHQKKGKSGTTLGLDHANGYNTLALWKCSPVQYTRMASEEINKIIIIKYVQLMAIQVRGPYYLWFSYNACLMA